MPGEGIQELSSSSQHQLLVFLHNLKFLTETQHKKIARDLGRLYLKYILIVSFTAHVWKWVISDLEIVAERTILEIRIA